MGRRCGQVHAARRPVYGRAEVARYLAGVLRPRSTGDVRITVAEVNGAPAVLGWAGERLVGVASLDVAAGRVTAVRFLANPDKLAFLEARSTPPGRCDRGHVPLRHVQTLRVVSPGNREDSAMTDTIVVTGGTGTPRQGTDVAAAGSRSRAPGARGKRRAVLPVRLPGAVVRGYRSGGHLAPDHADGRVSFAAFLTAPGSGDE